MLICVCAKSDVRLGFRPSVAANTNVSNSYDFQIQQGEKIVEQIGDRWETHFINWYNGPATYQKLLQFHFKIIINIKFPMQGAEDLIGPCCFETNLSYENLDDMTCFAIDVYQLQKRKFRMYQPMSTWEIRFLEKTITIQQQKTTPKIVLSLAWIVVRTCGRYFEVPYVLVLRVSNTSKAITSV